MKPRGFGFLILVSHVRFMPGAPTLSVLKMIINSGNYGARKPMFFGGANPGLILILLVNKVLFAGASFFPVNINLLP